MSVRLRLARGGTKKRPVYRIVATKSRSPRDGRSWRSSAPTTRSCRAMPRARGAARGAPPLLAWRRRQAERPGGALPRRRRHHGETVHAGAAPASGPRRSRPRRRRPRPQAAKNAARQPARCSRAEAAAAAPAAEAPVAEAATPEPAAEAPPAEHPSRTRRRRPPSLLQPKPLPKPPGDTVPASDKRRTSQGRAGDAN